MKQQQQQKNYFVDAETCDNFKPICDYKYHLKYSYLFICSWDLAMSWYTCLQSVWEVRVRKDFDWWTLLLNEKAKKSNEEKRLIPSQYIAPNITIHITNKSNKLIWWIPFHIQNVFMLFRSQSIEATRERNKKAIKVKLIFFSFLSLLSTEYERLRNFFDSFHLRFLKNDFWT